MMAIQRILIFIIKRFLTFHRNIISRQDIIASVREPRYTYLEYFLLSIVEYFQCEISEYRHRH